MLRKKNLYARPRKPFESARIKEEDTLIAKYALKNKREIWKTLAKINYFRRRIMALANATNEEREVLLNKLRNLGLNVNNSADVLGLKVEDLLERRLPTVVAKKKLANTPRQARQMVVHKKILIDGKVVNSPSYIVSVLEEDKISVKERKSKPKEEPAQETPEESKTQQESQEEVSGEKEENKEEKE